MSLQIKTFQTKILIKMFVRVYEYANHLEELYSFSKRRLILVQNNKDFLKKLELRLKVQKEHPKNKLLKSMPTSPSCYGI